MDQTMLVQRSLPKIAWKEQSHNLAKVSSYTEQSTAMHCTLGLWKANFIIQHYSLIAGI